MEIQASQTSKEVTPEVGKKTPPAEFKKRRDTSDETHWRQLGGSTPDENEKKKRPGINIKLLEFLVHKEAKVKGIDLAKTPLKPGFFDDLILILSRWFVGGSLGTQQVIDAMHFMQN